MNFESDPIFHQIVKSPEAAFLGTWSKSRLWGTENDPLEYLYKKLSEKNEDNLNIYFANADYLVNKHPYSELILTNEIDRKVLSIAMAQASLFDNLGFYGKNRGLLSAFSYLFYCDGYVDYSAVPGFQRRIVTKKKISGVDFRNRFEVFPELLKMKNLDNSLRHAVFEFLFGFTSWISIYSESNEEKYRHELIDKLAETGILNKKPSPVQLLSYFKSDEIQEFSKEIGVKFPARTKKDMISEIIQCCSVEIIKAKIDKWMSKSNNNGALYRENIQPVKLCIENRPLLKLFVQEQFQKLQIYMACIVPTRLNLTPTFPQNRKKLSETNPPIKRWDKYARARIDYYEPSEFSLKHQQIVEKIWSQECENIFNKSVNDSSARFETNFLLEKIVSYLQEANAFERFNSGGFVLEEFDGKFSWEENLLKFIQQKLAYLPAKEKTCPGCGEKFLNWSVPSPLAVLVKKNIQFCADCYEYIFSHAIHADTDQKDLLTDEQMLQYLMELSEAYGILPIKLRFHMLPPFPSEKQVEVGKVLLKIPAERIYADRFGSVRSALDKLGLIPEIIYTQRGAKCTASDGHICLSLGEKAIDDWLTMQKIEHEKEVYYPYHIDLNPNILKRVDWKVGSTYIEFAGLLGDPEYARKMEQKRQLCDFMNLSLVIIAPQELDSLDEKLSFLTRPTQDT